MPLSSKTLFESFKMMYHMPYLRANPKFSSTLDWDKLRQNNSDLLAKIDGFAAIFARSGSHQTKAVALNMPILRRKTSYFKARNNGDGYQTGAYKIEIFYHPFLGPNWITNQYARRILFQDDSISCHQTPKKSRCSVVVLSSKMKMSRVEAQFV